MSCQQCCGIRQEFNSKEGQKELKRFRRSGPDKTTMILIDLLRRAIQESGHTRLTLLDVGADGTVAGDFHVKVGPYGKDNIVCKAKGDQPCLLSVGELTGDAAHPTQSITFVAG